MASLRGVAQWDEHADVVVLGIGLAGSVAAVEAHDADPSADILIVEKMPERHAGGNSRVAGQTLCFPGDADSLVEYQRALNAPMEVPEDLLRAWAEARVEQQAWLESMAAEVGMELYAYSAWTGGADFPELPGADCIDGLYSLRPAQPRAARKGRARDDKLYPSTVWTTFKAHVDRRPVRVLYDTRATELVQDPDSLEVYGVLASRDGRRVAIRAARAVVVCVGGYSASAEMQRNYAGYERVAFIGSPANTGDGVKLLQKAGAALWHLRNRIYVSGIRFSVQVPEFEAAFPRTNRIAARSWLDLGADDGRFGNEDPAAVQQAHFKRRAHGNWVDMPYTQVLPVHMIFDETARTAGPLGDQHVIMGWNAVVEGYRWSPDNSAELERGWIVQAGSIRELAEKVGRDPDEVEATVARFNEACAAGHDADFGRDPASMAPIVTPPFYAVELVPCIAPTTGGGKRDERSRVLDHEGEPIPRLYEAGELGSMLCNLYQTGSFLTEAMTSGRAAGRNAVAERAWTEEPSAVGGPR